ncbi:helix-turn-helix domain-containing protein [Micromonospora zhanjiangensis]
MSQQMLADRLGRSKSWVDKVERGVRRLDKFSMIRSIAEVLRVDTSVLLSDQGAGTRSTDALGLAALRAALACHHVGERETPDPLPAGEPGRSVGHAWSAYQHAHYPQLVRMLPNLLGHLRRTPVIAGSTAGAGVFVQAYRITASVLVKLGEADLAWLAADRAMAAAGEDRLLAAVAAIPLGQALRAADNGRLAMAATIAAADRIATPTPHEGPPEELPLLGTLLAEAALSAAACGDASSVRELFDQAARIAVRVGERADRHRTGFGPASVEAARTAAAVELGDGRAAVRRHERLVTGRALNHLPVEHRAAHLVTAARAYLLVGDPTRAGRALVEADRTAPAEIRCRPVARTVIRAVLCGDPAPAGLAHLASLAGLLR